MKYSMRNSIVGVSGMGWLSRRASKRALAGLAVVGAGAIAGLVAGFSADPVQTSELSPAEIVALRFPGGSTRIAASQLALLPAAPAAVVESAPAPTGYVLASVGEGDPQAASLQVSSLMFSPFPTYASAAYSSPAKAPAPASSLPPQLATASIELPVGALAYAAPDADEPAMTAARPDGASAAPTSAKRAIQPPRPAANQGPGSPSNAVLNNAQIASIKERLKLTSYQIGLWPPVESALRDIAWQGRGDAGRKVASNTRSATIDPNSVPVQRLKSAAFPLIMSLSDDQKQEVRTMVRLMGLENLASQF
jgi:hypothetical protein